MNVFNLCFFFLFLEQILAAVKKSIKSAKSVDLRDLRADKKNVTDNEPHFNSLCQLKEYGEWE